MGSPWCCAQSESSLWDVANPLVGLPSTALVAAVRREATAVAADGAIMTITSGCRSAEFHQQLPNDRIATYGSIGAVQWYVEASHFELAADAVGNCPPRLSSAVGLACL